MGTLSEADREILEALSDGNHTSEELAETLDRDPADLEDRLDELHDNGLVHGKANGWALTRNGHHLLKAPGDGSADDRVDTPDDVAAEIEAFQLRPDREDAIRSAFTFLQFWGETTSAELIDAIYDEHPAGHDDPDDWWGELVREYLTELPGVERPGDGDDVWRYDPEDTAADSESAAPASDAAEATDDQPPERSWSRGQRDGRETGDDAPEGARGSTKHALETIDVAEAEREAIVAAVSILRDREVASADELSTAVHADYDAGFDAPEALWEDALRPALETLPEIERRGDDQWRYVAPTGASDRTPEGASEDAAPDAEDTAEADVCPVCGTSYRGRSVHLTSGTMVPARNARSCVRATPTDAGASITIYYHGE